MAPTNFFARVMQYIANELVVKGLANSPAFQRFAVRSQAQMRDLSKNAAETAKALSDTPAINDAVKVSFSFRQRALSLASRAAQAYV